MIRSILSGLMLIAPVAHAAIIPSWRVNPINPAAVIEAPSLAGAMSVSLMVELTDGSLFNTAVLDLDSVFGGITAGTVAPNYYNNAFGSANNAPPAGLLVIFPSLYLDTYVKTTNDAQSAATAGGHPGGPPEYIGDGGFRVVWGATPNTGGTGPIEIARITIREGNGLRPIPGLTPLNGPGQLPLQGRVSDQFGAVGLPPIPLAIAPIPEPAAGVVLAWLWRPRRRRAPRFADTRPIYPGEEACDGSR